MRTSSLVLASDLVGGHGGAADGQRNLLPLRHDCNHGVLEGAFILIIWCQTNVLSDREILKEPLYLQPYMIQISIVSIVSLCPLKTKQQSNINATSLVHCGHFGVRVGEPRAHDVGPRQHKLDGSLVHALVRQHERVLVQKPVWNTGVVSFMT